MKSFTTFLVAFLLLGCASGSDSNDPNSPAVDVHITGTDLTRDTLYLGGPVSVRFALTVHNPTNEPLSFRSIDLRTVGPASFALRSGVTNVNQQVPASGTTTIRVSGWGQSRGGYIAADEPITVRGIAVFQRPNQKSFQRIFTDTLSGQ